MSVIIKPVISEKAINLSKQHWFSFAAPTGMSKQKFAAHIKEKYKVKPLAISSLIIKGERRRRGKHFFQTQAVKKFYVRLPKEIKITAFEATK